MRNPLVSRLSTAAAAALLAVACGSAPVEQPAAPAEEAGLKTGGYERGSPEQLKALASRPTPHLPDGRPDLNATWDHLGGIEFVPIREKVPGEDESVCIFGCAPPPGQPGATPTGPPPQGPPGPGFTKYKPE